MGEAANLAGVKVMVIDDSNTIRRSAEIFLVQAGCKVILAEDGFDALSKITDHQPGARPNGGLGRISHQALYEGQSFENHRRACARSHLRRFPMPVKKILIVDDSPTDRQFFMETLSKHGYQCVTAESGEEAIAKSKSEKPDLILMDVVMPGTNGFQATRAITRDEATKHIPVIVVTSKNQETDKVWGMRQGAKDYLMKPIDAKELVAKIAAIK